MINEINQRIKLYIISEIILLITLSLLICFISTNFSWLTIIPISFNLSLIIGIIFILKMEINTRKMIINRLKLNKNNSWL